METKTLRTAIFGQQKLISALEAIAAEDKKGIPSIMDGEAMSEVNNRMIRIDSQINLALSDDSALDITALFSELKATYRMLIEILEQTEKIDSSFVNWIRNSLLDLDANS